LAVKRQHFSIRRFKRLVFEAFSKQRRKNSLQWGTRYKYAISR
jgi:hypothetical protein